MIDILNLEKKRISEDLKGKFAFIYGPPKIGKTTFVANMPKCLIFSFEPGTNGLDDIYSVPITSWKDFKIAVKQLENPKAKEKYDFCAFDTIDIAYELCEQWICAQNSWSDIRDGAYGRGYDLLKKEFSSAFRKIAQLEYGLIFISHSTEKTLKDANNQEYTQIIPAAAPRARDIVNKLVDFIIYIGEVKNPETKEPERVMFLRGDERVLAGSRFQYVPDTIPLDYKTFVKTVVDAVKHQASTSGLESTNEKDSFYANDSHRPFKEVFAETEKVWYDIVRKDDSDGTYNKLASIIQKNFGQIIQLSSVTESQQDILELTLEDLKDFYNQM